MKVRVFNIAKKRIHIHDVAKVLLEVVYMWPKYMQFFPLYFEMFVFNDNAGHCSRAGT